MVFMSAPWLSVLIPIYNVEKYLEDCIVSVTSQVDAGVEILLVDDCSTDSSLMLAEAIVTKSAHPIRLLRHTKNGGLSAARNTLLEAANGEYIWFLDSDDVLKSDAIESLKNIVNKHNPDLILCDYEIWYPDNIHENKHVKSFAGIANHLLDNPMALFSGLFESGRLHSWSKISKKSLWADNLRFPEGCYFEDVATTPRLALRVESYFYVDSPWVGYRQRDQSILSNLNEQKIRHMIAALRDIDSDWFSKHEDCIDDKQLYSFYKYAIRIFFYAKTELKRIHRVDLLPEYRAFFFEVLNRNKIALALLCARNSDFARFFKVVLLV
jgi:glycosyltransferase involved in cell wall biosynthesis